MSTLLKNEVGLEPIYVNATGSMVCLSLPSGGSYRLASGEGIRGVHFARACRAGLLTIVTGPGQAPAKVHDPLRLGGGSKSAKPTATSEPHPAPVVPPALVVYKDKDLAVWRVYFQTEPDLGVLASLKLEDLQALAKLFGASLAQSTMTKMEILRAIRGTFQKH